MNELELQVIKNKLEHYLEKAKVEQGVQMIFFMLTNILDQSTEVIYIGKNAKEALEMAFQRKAENGSVRVPKVVSRKKQFIPAMLHVLSEL